MMSANKTKQKQETAFNKNGASGTTAQLVGIPNSAGSENTGHGTSQNQRAGRLPHHQHTDFWVHS